jgi:hypothetical protein
VAAAEAAGLSLKPLKFFPTGTSMMYKPEPAVSRWLQPHHTTCDSVTAGNALFTGEQMTRVVEAAEGMLRNRGRTLVRRCRSILSNPR